MNRLLLIFLVSALSCKILCDWGKPSLVRDVDDKDHIPAMIDDSKTGTAYTFYSYTLEEGNNITYYFCFRAFGPNKMNPTQHCVHQQREVLNVSVDKSYNGDALKFYVAYSAIRTPKAGECKDTGEGCTDIFFTESGDAGKTWSAAIPVPRKDAKDKYPRASPKIVFTYPSLRLFIAYVRWDLTANTVQGVYVTRPSGSTILSNEAVAFSIPLYLTNFYFMITSTKTITTLQFVFWDMTGLGVTYSTNNGVQWEHYHPYVEPYLTDVALSTAYLGARESICILSRTRNNAIRLDWQSNGGWKYKKWAMTGKNITLSYFGSPARSYLLSGLINSNNEVGTYTFNSDTGELVRVSENCPSNTYPDALAVNLNDEYNTKVLHVIDDDVYLSAYQK